MKYKVLDLFSGIGGFSLGLERTGGFETVAFCEIEKFPQKVLAKHWPDVPIYEDVRELTYEKLLADTNIIKREKRGDDKPNEKESGSRGDNQGRSRSNDSRKPNTSTNESSRYRPDGTGWIDVITGGFPCQDISVAGNQKGIGEGTRSGLWSECARLLGDIRPRYAIFENVTALISGDNGRWFEQVLWDISKVGYDAEWHCISASELGAHHHRDRVWIIAYPSEIGCRHRGDNRKKRHVQIDKKRGTEEIQQEWDKRQPGSSETRSILADPNSVARKGSDKNKNSVEKREESNDESVSRRSGGSGNRLCDVADTERGTTQAQLSRKIFALLRETHQGRETNRPSSQHGHIGEEWATEPELGRVANGIPDRAHRLKGLGNAVVPQIPELIGRAILEAEKCN